MLIPDLFGFPFLIDREQTIISASGIDLEKKDLMAVIIARNHNKKSNQNLPPFSRLPAAQELEGIGDPLSGTREYGPSLDPGL